MNKENNIINVHIISHTHWDREWFLNSRYTKEWLIPFFQNLFKIIEKNKNYKFILDGQTLIIEDFFEQLKIEQRKNRKDVKDIKNIKNKLKFYIQNKHIIIGPYYLQPDYNLISDEAIIRNLLIGIKESKKFGEYLKAGWLLDNFGQISQLVQIHKGFGIKGLFVWRGVFIDPDNLKTEFIWQSSDGSELLTEYFIDSYRNAMRLSEFPSLFKDRIINEVNKLKPFLTTNNILLMNGYDQEFEPDDILKLINIKKIEGLNIFQSDPENYIQYIIKNYKNYKKENIPILKGQLYSGDYISVFPGVLSSRVYLKILNDKFERFLTSYIEPLCYFASLCNYKYPYLAINNLWKTLLKNHPHDSICGVSIDDVHIDMENRYKLLYKKSRKLLKKCLEKIVYLIDTHPLFNFNTGTKNVIPFIVFNLSQFDMNYVVNLKIKNDKFQYYNFYNFKGEKLESRRINNKTWIVKTNLIKSYGYETLYAIPEDFEELKIKKEIRKKKNFNIKKNNEFLKINSEKFEIENFFIKLKINNDGTFNITDKTNRIDYKNLAIIEESADAGDTYNYSYCKFDNIFYSYNSNPKIKFKYISDIETTIIIKHELKIPKCLNEDRSYRSKKYIKFPILIHLSINSFSPLVSMKIILKNTAKDHRLRLLFPSGIIAKKSFSFSKFDNHVYNEIYPEKIDFENFPENVKRVILGAKEIEPITTFPFYHVCGINNKENGLNIFSKGLYEYEIIKNPLKKNTLNKDTIAVTLLRGVGWLARSDLLTRDGDAGPNILVPDAQCLRNLEFDIAILPFNNKNLNFDVNKNLSSFLKSPLIVKTDLHKGILSNNFNIMKILPEEFIITSLKRAETENCLILRGFNSSGKTIKVKLKFNIDLEKVFITDLNENSNKLLNIDTLNNIVTLNLKKFKIVTLKIFFKKSDITKKHLTISNKKNLNFYFNENFTYNFNSKIFKNYESVEIITIEDILNENIRKNKLYDKYKFYLRGVEQIKTFKEYINNLEKPLNITDNVLKKIELIFYELKSKETTYYRLFLEAELSFILSIKKFIEIYKEKSIKLLKDFYLSSDQLEKKLREIGLKLNKARINKRIYDYLLELVRFKYSKS